MRKSSKPSSEQSEFTVGKAENLIEEIADLGKKEEYDPKKDFRKIQEILTRINGDDLEQYKTIARRLIDSMKTDKDRIS